MSDDLEQRFRQHVQQRLLLPARCRLLVAVSGGPDSVTLLHLCCRLGLSVVVGHVNHQLRGAQSDADEAFVKQLAASRHIPFAVHRVNTLEFAAEKKLSLQQAARHLRYEALEAMRRAFSLQRIATAHHADDAVETLLLNLFRGTGIRGLAGIPEKKGRIIRPLMPFTKDELLDYARRQGLTYMEDETNYQSVYTRNKIRLEIIPVIEQHFPAFRSVLLRQLPLYRQAAELLDAVLEKKLNRLLRRLPDSQHLPIKSLRGQPALLLLGHWLRPYGFNAEQIVQLTQALQQAHGSRFVSPTHRLLVDRKFLVLTELQRPSATTVTLPADVTRLVLPQGTLQARLLEKWEAVSDNPHEHWLDADKLQFPLLLRPWRAGDYFYPFGMKRKKKKVSDLLTDMKLSLWEKEQTCVVLSGDRICCVLGHRTDDRFRITAATRRVLKLSWQAAAAPQG